MIKWSVDKKIFRTEDYKLNNRVANRLAKKNFNIICQHYTHITPRNIFSLLKMNREIWKSFKGVGLDVGGGIGLVSSIIAKKKKCKKNLLCGGSKKCRFKMSAYYKKKNFKK